MLILRVIMREFGRLQLRVLRRRVLRDLNHIQPQKVNLFYLKTLFLEEERKRQRLILNLRGKFCDLNTIDLSGNALYVTCISCIHFMYFMFIV